MNDVLKRMCGSDVVRKKEKEIERAEDVLWCKNLRRAEAVVIRHVGQTQRTHFPKNGRSAASQLLAGLGRYIEHLVKQ